MEINGAQLIIIGSTDNNLKYLMCNTQTLSAGCFPCKTGIRTGDTNPNLIQSVSHYLLVYLFICVWVFCLHACMCNMHISGAHGIQKKVMNSLELELQKIANCRACVGN